jgi:hypothetical protein
MALQRFILTEGVVNIIGTTKEMPMNVENIEVDITPTAPKGIYDLMGRRISTHSTDTHTLAPGIYIIDGRKVVVK